MPRFHVIAGDAVVGAQDCRNRLSPVIEAGRGALALHLRTRSTPASRLFEIAAWAAKASRASGTLVVVNDRVDVALAAGVGGVHLREDSLPVETVRAIAGARLRVGRSIHAPEQAADLRRHGLDYLVMGAAFATTSHPDRAPAGPEAVAAAAARADVPVLAIGGITPAKVPSLLSRGVHGVVVMSGVWGRDDPARSATRYLQVLHKKGLH